MWARQRCQWPALREHSRESTIPAGTGLGNPQGGRNLGLGLGQPPAGELDARLTISSLLQTYLRLSPVPQVEPEPFPCPQPGAGQQPKAPGSQNCLARATPFSTPFDLLDSSREPSARPRPHASLEAGPSLPNPVNLGRGLIGLRPAPRGVA